MEQLLSMHIDTSLIVANTNQDSRESGFHLIFPPGARRGAGGGNSNPEHEEVRESYFRPVGVYAKALPIPANELPHAIATTTTTTFSLLPLHRTRGDGRTRGRSGATLGARNRSEARTRFGGRDRAKARTNVECGQQGEGSSSVQKKGGEEMPRREIGRAHV